MHLGFKGVMVCDHERRQKEMALHSMARRPH